jgi:hypothetical protein
MITELPAEEQNVSLAPLSVNDISSSDTTSDRSGNQFLSDEEVIELLSRNNESEIRANAARIPPAQRRAVLEAIGQR